MRKATLYLSYHLQNRVFDLSDKDSNRDNCLQWFHDLKLEFEARAFDLSTQDINPVESSEVVIYQDMPRSQVSTSRAKSFLLIMEPPVVKPAAWDRQNWKLFEKIFTYDDSIVNGENYIKFNYAYQIPKMFPNADERQKLCATIIGFKSSRHPFELYSKRLEVIRWFEENQPDNLDLFGVGWEDCRLRERGLRHLLLRRRKPMLTYKGRVASKLAALSQYKFAFCFENCGGVQGYISEKIFDVFFAGTVPIYLGAPNVQDHIPADCFIDFRNFSSTAELAQLLTSMTDKRRLSYVEAAQDFLKSASADPFRSHLVARSVTDHVLGVETRAI